METIVTPKVWNKLTLEEKIKRVREFRSHLDSLPPQAPIDFSYLTELAVMYQTPVPHIRLGDGLDWGQYK